MSFPRQSGHAYYVRIIRLQNKKCSNARYRRIPAEYQCVLGRKWRPVERIKSSIANATSNIRQKKKKNILTPIMAFSSVMVTCFARSTAVATCCWCSWERNGRICAMIAFSLLAISVCNTKQLQISFNYHLKVKEIQQKKYRQYRSSTEKFIGTRSYHLPIHNRIR